MESLKVLDMGMYIYLNFMVLKQVLFQLINQLKASIVIMGVTNQGGFFSLIKTLL
jgi:hypothetical protein